MTRAADYARYILAGATLFALVTLILRPPPSEGPAVAPLRKAARSNSSIASTAKDAFRILYPQTETVTVARPVFQWTPLPGASSYLVTVQDAQGRVVAQSPHLTGTGWTPSEPLPAGTYIWQVSAGSRIAPQPPEPLGRFTVSDLAVITPVQPSL
ncbi:MAG: T9SS type A sorting domain-containing protein [Bryobacteraceae bacterium]|nr:T9SS type A sorting domain-containing protein [Bryobacteraceae bacterium]